MQSSSPKGPDHFDTKTQVVGEIAIGEEEYRNDAREAAKRAKSAILDDLRGVRSSKDPSNYLRVMQIEDLRVQVELEEAAFDSLAERLKSPYIISEILAMEHRTAKKLGKPHLVEGDPGTGKTALAYAIAAGEGLPIIHCRGKSTLTAQAVMYEVDYVGRLNDAMLAQNIPDLLRNQTKQWVDYLEKGGDPNAADFRNFMIGFEGSAKLLNLDKVSDIRRYIKFGELGEAIVRAASGESVVLLIDEIDKARREFANDLLDELEHLTIRIRETGEEISAPKSRIRVIITSNHERDLPDAFLRRCVYSYIDFPDQDQMAEIVRAHVPDIAEKLLDSALKRFYEIRGRNDIVKKPSTSEMIDWIRVLQEFGIDKISGETPFIEALIKVKEDLDRLGEKGKKTDKLIKAGLPESVVAALNGGTVVCLRSDSPGENPSRNVLAALVNAGYSFTTAKREYQDSREFSIKGEGIRTVGRLTLELLPYGQDESGTFRSPNPLYELLDRLNAIQSKLVVTDKKQTFAYVDDSNPDFTVGRDSVGNKIYRMSDGRYVVEESVARHT